MIAFCKERSGWESPPYACLDWQSLLVLLAPHSPHLRSSATSFSLRHRLECTCGPAGIVLAIIFTKSDSSSAGSPAATAAPQLLCQFVMNSPTRLNRIPRPRALQVCTFAFAPWNRNRFRSPILGSVAGCSSAVFITLDGQPEQFSSSQLEQVRSDCTPQTWEQQPIMENHVPALMLSGSSKARWRPEHFDFGRVR